MSVVRVASGVNEGTDEDERAEMKRGRGGERRAGTGRGSVARDIRWGYSLHFVTRCRGSLYGLFPFLSLSLLPGLRSAIMTWRSDEDRRWKRPSLSERVGSYVISPFPHALSLLRPNGPALRRNEGKWRGEVAGPEGQNERPKDLDRDEFREHGE